MQAITSSPHCCVTLHFCQSDEADPNAAGRQDAQEENSSAGNGGGTFASALKELLMEARIAVQLQAPSHGQQTAAHHGAGAGKAGGMSEAEAVGVLNKDFSVFDGANTNGKTDGRANIKDLQAVANNPNASREDRAAADYLLTHKDALDSVDTADRGGTPDGSISSSDAAVFAQSRGVASSV
jgi:hypothetical protein